MTAVHTHQHCAYTHTSPLYTHISTESSRKLGTHTHTQHNTHTNPKSRQPHSNCMCTKQTIAFMKLYDRNLSNLYVGPQTRALPGDWTHRKPLVLHCREQPLNIHVRKVRSHSLYVIGVIVVIVINVYRYMCIMFRIIIRTFPYHLEKCLSDIISDV